MVIGRGQNTTPYILVIPSEGEYYTMVKIFLSSWFFSSTLFFHCCFLPTSLVVYFFLFFILLFLVYILMHQFACLVHQKWSAAGCHRPHLHWCWNPDAVLVPPYTSQSVLKRSFLQQKNTPLTSTVVLLTALLNVCKIKQVVKKKLLYTEILHSIPVLGKSQKHVFI